MPRFGLVPLALMLLFGFAGRAEAQPANSKAPDTAAMDSLKAALGQFERPHLPTAADSAALRRWADSVRAKGRSLRNRSPAEARAYFQQGLQASRTLADSLRIGVAIREVGITHLVQSQYEDALPYFQNALHIHRQIGNRKGVARALNNIGLVHRNQSRYEEALDQYRESLQIERDLGNPRGVARTLNNIGLLHKNQGQYGEALSRYQEALEISRGTGNRPRVAQRLHNIGSVHRNQGQYGKALDRYQDALQIMRDLGNRRGVGIILNGIGLAHEEAGRLEEALVQYSEALEIFRNLEIREGISVALGNTGNIYKKQGQHEEALANYRRSIEIDREIGDQRGIAKTLISIGSTYLEKDHLQVATDTLAEAVRRAEQLRLNATSPSARRSLLSTQIEAYQTLTTAHVRLGRPDSALRAVEQARARLLADRLAGTAAGDTAFALPSVAALRRTIGPDEAALLYANAESNWPLTVLAVTRDTTVARELPDSSVRARIEREYPTLLNRLRREKGPLTAALGPRTSSGQGGTPSLAEIIRLYRYYLTRGQTDTSIQKDLSQRLHGLLLEPIDAIADKRELIAVPGGALGYLPLETLRDSTGTYLTERKHVRYAQSLTVRGQLRERDYPKRTRPLLALGGATYAPDETTGEEGVIAEARRGTTRVGSSEHASTIFRDASRRMKQGKSPRPTYQQLGYGQWTDLPETEPEVQQLGKIVGKEATVLTGAGVSEDSVRTLDEQERLRAYRRLHFATHGVAVPETPALSALVLSQVEVSDSLASEDGYLTMEEIADLDLRADVAVLSACQTGLGKVVAGEGVVSLSHAFLRAGANATLVSQWKVLDESTRQFMMGVYERAETKNTSFAEAVTETRRAFIAGEYGQKNTDPLRWAPFVYYGRE